MNSPNLKCLATMSLLGLAVGAPAQGYLTFDNSENNSLSWSATSQGRIFVGLFVPGRQPGSLLNEDVNFELLAWTYTPQLQITSLGKWLLSDGSAQGVCLGDGLFRDPAGRSIKLGNYIQLPPPLIPLEVRAWLGSYSSFTDALHYGPWFGWADSGPFQNPVSPFENAPATLTGMPAFMFSFIPEPSTLVLAVVGALTLLFVRRRKNPSRVRRVLHRVVLLTVCLPKIVTAQSTIYFDNVGNSNPSLTATASGLVWIAVTPESPYTLLN